MPPMMIQPRVVQPAPQQEEQKEVLKESHFEDDDFFVESTKEYSFISKPSNSNGERGLEDIERKLCERNNIDDVITLDK